MKTGILGGTFNPPHTGHLIIAEHVRQQLDLDKILFVPTALPPHKQEDEIIGADHRLEMVRHAINGNDHFDVSDIEVVRGGVSFTVDTLNELKNRSPEEVLFLLIGMDNVRDFHTWKDPARILELATVVALTRPGFPVERGIISERRILLCEVPEIQIASSSIRLEIRKGKSVRYLVPQEVEWYIEKHRLYR